MSGPNVMLPEATVTNLGKYRTRSVLDYLREAKGHATLKNMSVGNICTHPDTPCTMPDGSPITERNVDEFIRSRVRLHHGSWIIGMIDCALDIIEGRSNG